MRRWQVPVCYRTSASSAPRCRLLDDVSAQWSFGGGACPQWVFANADGRGYYRTAYATDMLADLAKAPLSEAERLAFAADEWALVRGGVHTVGDYLTVAAELIRGRSPAVVGEVAKQLRFIRDVVAPDGARGAFDRTVRRFLAPAAAELGPAPRPRDTEDQRALVASAYRAAGADAVDGFRKVLLGLVNEIGRAHV